MFGYRYCLAALILLMGCELNNSPSNDAFKVIHDYLSDQHNLNLSEDSVYVVCIFYCQHCGNCTDKINKRELRRFSNFANTVFVFDQPNALAEVLKRKGICRVVIDHDMGMYKFGLEGTRNRVFAFSKGKLVLKRLLLSGE